MAGGQRCEEDELVHRGVRRSPWGPGWQRLALGERAGPPALQAVIGLPRPLGAQGGWVPGRPCTRQALGSLTQKASRYKDRQSP